MQGMRMKVFSDWLQHASAGFQDMATVLQAFATLRLGHRLPSCFFNLAETRASQPCP